MFELHNLRDQPISTYYIVPLDRLGRIGHQRGRIKRLGFDLPLVQSEPSSRKC